MTRSALRALVRRAIASLRAHALRSALSLLGILFGVASITAMSSVTEGARREALSQIGDLGADTLVARVRATTANGVGPELTIEDTARLRSALPGLLTLAPIRSASVEIPGPSGAIPATLVGTSETYALATRYSLARGRTLTALDVAGARRIAILGADIASAAFPDRAAVGERLVIGEGVFDIVGVLEPRATRRSGRSAAPILGRDLNKCVIVPWNSVAGHARSESEIDEVLIRMQRSDDARALAAAARRTLESTLGRDAVELVVPLEVLRQQQRTQSVFAAVTGATSLICLLVGGVGIMNILLASVSERIHEIGIRRAVGATREDIGAQFLAEGVLLSAGGGLLGLLLGGGAALLIQRWASWSIAAAPGLIAIGFLSSVLTGVAAGGYPAWKAANLEVMEALRRG